MGVNLEVTNEFFDKRNAAGKHTLLPDQHHGVCAAAALYRSGDDSASKLPYAVTAPTTPVAPATIAQVAAIVMNGKLRR